MAIADRDELDNPEGATPLPRKRSTLASLRVHNYRNYFIGQSISVAGNWMQAVAAGWLTLQLTNDGVMLGLITAARYAPVLLLAPWGGVIADRLDKLRLLMVTQMLSAVLTGALGLLALAGAIEIWMLFALITALGVVNIFDGPARQSMISNLVARELLPNAIALNSIAMNVSRVLGPALAGALIATIGVSLCFLANGLSFVVVAALLLTMRRSEFIESALAVKARGQIREGFTYVARTPELLLPLLLVAVTGTFTWEYPVSLPLLTTNTFGQGPEAYGLALASLGLGCVIGGVVAARGREPSTTTMSRTAVFWGAAMLALGFAPTLWSAYVLLLPVGFFAVTFNSSAKTVLQLNAPAQMRGRVMALWSMGWQGSTVIGAPLIGAVGEMLGARASIWAGAVAASCFGLVVLLWFRRWVTRHAGGSEG